ncbi:MAG: Sua5/YciO/YrdC/YwlC family protein [Planctomycetes bacterium]|nr:Sua5/YciO/YrdC/YwlC family protein [Planctomycetota bacterium]
MGAKILGADQVDEAARLLRAGKLVAFPTDTVYGVAALADAGFHSANLAAFKGGRPEPFALHAPDVESALRFVGDLHELERHAVTGLCPRGVTVIVAQGPQQKGLGLRVVRHDVGSEFLSGAGAAVVATSANVHGQPPLRDPGKIAELPGLDAVLDAGELPERPASTVVRLLRCGVEILREGAVSRDKLGRLFTRSVEFVCLGNLNRSAFAHRLLEAMQAWYADRLTAFVPGYSLASSGLIARPTARSPRPMQAAAAANGVDLKAHRPTRFVASRVANADLAISMGADVADEVRAASAPAQCWSVLDPMGGSERGYFETAAQVRAHMETLLARTARIRESDDALEAGFEKLFSRPGETA